MKARVLPGNSYGAARSGDIVEVDDDEIKKVPWCLEAVDEEAEAKAAAEAADAIGQPRTLTEEDIAHITKLIDDARQHAADAATEAAQLREENAQLRAELEALRAPQTQTSATSDLPKPPTAVDQDQASQASKPVEGATPPDASTDASAQQGTAKKGKAKP